MLLPGTPREHLDTMQSKCRNDIIIAFAVLKLASRTRGVNRLAPTAHGEKAVTYIDVTLLERMPAHRIASRRQAITRGDATAICFLNQLC